MQRNTIDWIFVYVYHLDHLDLLDHLDQENETNQNLSNGAETTRRVPDNRRRWEPKSGAGEKIKKK